MSDNAQDPNPNQGNEGVQGAAGNQDEQPDLSTLFTADEVKAKQESIVTAKAEEDRRAKLKPDEIAAEDKAKADAEVADKVPEEYAEFTAPEGMKIDQAMLTEALPMFKELGLSQAKAQQLVDLYSTKIGPAFIKAQTEAWHNVIAGWEKESRANKELNLSSGKPNEDGIRVLNTLFNAEEAARFKKEIMEHKDGGLGIGNHLLMNLLMKRMSKHMKEDTLETPGSAGVVKPPADFESLAKSIYSQ